SPRTVGLWSHLYTQYTPRYVESFSREWLFFAFHGFHKGVFHRQTEVIGKGGAGTCGQDGAALLQKFLQMWNGFVWGKVSQHRANGIRNLLGRRLRPATVCLTPRLKGRDTRFYEEDYVILILQVAAVYFLGVHYMESKVILFQHPSYPPGGHGASVLVKESYAGRLNKDFCFGNTFGFFHVHAPFAGHPGQHFCSFGRNVE